MICSGVRMTQTPRAPTQWCLTKTETVTTFESWRRNIQHSTLSLYDHFSPFLLNGTQWEKKTKSNPLRGLTNDPDTDSHPLTAQQKVIFLELLLGQIANYCPIISRNTIVKNSTSINSIWQLIHTHYGFQSTGTHFTNFMEMRLDTGELSEDLFPQLTENTIEVEDIHTNHSQQRFHKARRPSEICPLYRTTKRPDTHYLSASPYLPELDRKKWTKSRYIVADDPKADEYSEESGNVTQYIRKQVRRVQVKHSPYINLFYKHHALRVALDSGSTTNMIKESTALQIGAIITKSSQNAVHDNDLSSRNIIVGKTRVKVTRDEKIFTLDTLVVKEMDVDILGGVPFMDINDITIRAARNLIILGDGTTYRYDHDNDSLGNNTHTVKTTDEAQCLRTDIVNSLGDNIHTVITTDEAQCLRTDTVNSLGDNIHTVNTTDEAQCLRMLQSAAMTSVIIVPS